MANIDDPTGTQPAVETGGGGFAVPEPAFQVDPERYQALEAYYARTNPVLEQYKEDFTPLLEDEKFREFYRSSRESYYDMQKRLAKEAEDAIPESEKRLLGAIDERLSRFKPVLDEYETRAQAQTRAAQEASQDFAKRETEFANRLVAEQKLTPEEVNDLAQYAMTLHKKSVDEGNPRFVGIEEVYKRVYGRAEAKVTAKPTPRSLRATSGATGVPGASRTIEDRGDITRPGGVTRHILGVLNSQRKTG